MRRWIVTAVQRLLERTPYRIVRRGLGHRFQAIEDLLHSINSRGYRPDIVIDGGANIGDFARLARKIWSEAHIVMIEPQPACEARLRALAASGNFEVVMAALGKAAGTLHLSATSVSTSTGAHVVEHGQSAVDEVLVVPVLTLSDVISQTRRNSQSILLKLDLQGYELNALHGAGPALDQVDAILTEASFYAQAYEPAIADLVTYLASRGFDLHDIGALAGRRRDGRAHQADLFFARRGSLLTRDTRWS